MANEEETQGQPGQAGEEGSPPGGTGGKGGKGGTGQRGKTGRPGRTSFLPIIGYLILSLGIVGGFVRSNSISQRNAKAITLLCAQKVNIRRDIERAEGFLTEHPQGTVDFSVELIEASLRDMHVHLALYDKTLKDECRDEPTH